MAITGSGVSNLGAKAYDNLASKASFDTLSSNVGQRMEITGADLAGVTTDMATNIATAIDTYVSDVSTKLSELSGLEVTGGVKGTKIEASVANFITKVTTLCNNIVTELTTAEKTIVDEVKKAFQTQDQSVSTSMDSDAEVSAES